MKKMEAMKVDSDATGSGKKKSRKTGSSTAGYIGIGELAGRTGLSVSAVRFYNDKKLLPSIRSPGGSRLFHRSTIRRVSFILICQQLGYTLLEIGEALAALPDARTPTKADWLRLSLRFGRDIDDRISQLTLLRKKLSGCIGCGCLSLRSCSLYNANDVAAEKGAGPRYLLGDEPN